MQYLSQRTDSVRRPAHEYRVLAIRRREAFDVVWLTNDRRDAIELAEQLSAILVKRWCSDAGGSNDDVRSVRVERRTGDVTQRQWKVVWPSAADGTRNARTRRETQPGKRLPGLPESGAIVECVLLAEKTRRGGWKARLAKLGLVGPITNHQDVPFDAVPNQTVRLRIGAVSQDGRHLQFAWPQNGLTHA